MYIQVGPKVADCVCLMSLGKTFVVPVDTHVWSIAQPYLPHLNGKTLTAKAYAEIGQFYHTLHGSYAGWAHSVCIQSCKRRKTVHRETQVIVDGEDEEMCQTTIK